MYSTSVSTKKIQLSSNSLTKFLQNLGVGQAEARIQKLQLGLPQGCRAQLLQLSLGVSQNAEAGLNSTHTDVGYWCVRWLLSVPHANPSTPSYRYINSIMELHPHNFPRIELLPKALHPNSFSSGVRT